MRPPCICRALCEISRNVNLYKSSNCRTICCTLTRLWRDSIGRFRVIKSFLFSADNPGHRRKVLAMLSRNNQVRLIARLKAPDALFERGIKRIRVRPRSLSRHHACIWSCYGQIRAVNGQLRHEYICMDQMLARESIREYLRILY